MGIYKEWKHITFRSWLSLRTEREDRRRTGRKGKQEPLGGSLVWEDDRGKAQGHIATRAYQGLGQLSQFIFQLFTSYNPHIQYIFNIYTGEPPKGQDIIYIPFINASHMTKKWLLEGVSQNHTEVARERTKKNIGFQKV